MEMETPTPPEDVDRLRAAIERADAPAALRLRVGRQIRLARQYRARRRRMSIGVLAAGGTLAASVAVFGLPRGSPPSVMQVVRVAAEARRAPAPPVDRTDPRRLAVHVDDVWFPSWRGLHWHAVGRSSETVAGRRAVTVYYARDDGVQVAYTIVGRKWSWPNDARAVTHGWMRLHLYSGDGQRMVTWRERGYQCVIAGPRALPEATLLALAADDVQALAVG
jgi:hypothetical protein